MDIMNALEHPVRMLVNFSDDSCPPPSVVGGKAYSLIKMTKLGFAVPPGAVLTTRFFTAWFKQITDSPAWTDLLQAEHEQWEKLCQQLQLLCLNVDFDTEQHEILMQLAELSRSWGENTRVAVRSSSPEEDMQSTSFAGGYDSFINVAATNLNEAIKKCFASCFSARLLTYKKRQGFDLSSPKIAVIVQQQIDSQASGVGFSVNPLTNDYDEALIEANWGLGETTVAGLSSPDQIIVNKHSRAISGKKLGDKQLSMWTTPEGETVSRQAYRSVEYCITTQQVHELTDAIYRAENAFAHALDIEWAYAGNRLYLLQARPITTLIPLPTEMVSAPGERRNLYIDVALAKGLTINAPISPLGLDFVKSTVSSIFNRFVGPVNFSSDPNASLLCFAGGRMYFNLSKAMVLINPKNIAKKIAINDVMLAKILGNIDKKRYRAEGSSLLAGMRLLGLLPRIMWGCRNITRQFFAILLFPERMRQDLDNKFAAFKKEVRDHIDYTLPLDDFQKRYTDLAVKHMVDDTLAPVCAALAAMEWVDFLVGRKNSNNRRFSEQLKLGFKDNLVIKLGVAMYQLAGQFTVNELEDLPSLARRLQNRQMPEDFLLTWDAFMQEFGCRGPMEMDLATPRYADSPQLLLSQIVGMANNSGKFNPREMSQRKVVKREQAYAALMDNVGWLRRKLLRRLYTLIDLYGGTRDTPKHQTMLINYAMRQRALQEGQVLVENKRLDSADHVFDLIFSDLQAAIADPHLDLRALRAQRIKFIEKLRSQVASFPIAIDSRGRILRPKVEEEIPGQLRGEPLSPGVAIGHIKILNTPDEKPVTEGDILVAYTTDPSWTPLFVNAAAIVLEVGGVLQHGAVVAREYGKPCIAGINNVLNKLQDGQRVEVNGDTGVLKILS